MHTFETKISSILFVIIVISHCFVITLHSVLIHCFSLFSLFLQCTLYTSTIDGGRMIQMKALKLPGMS